MGEVEGIETGITEIKDLLSNSQGEVRNAKAKSSRSSYRRDKPGRAYLPLGISTQTPFATQLQERANSQTTEHMPIYEDHVVPNTSTIPILDVSSRPVVHPSPNPGRMTIKEGITSQASCAAGLDLRQISSAGSPPFSLPSDSSHQQANFDITMFRAPEDGETGVRVVEVHSTSETPSRGTNNVSREEEGYPVIEVTRLDMETIKNPFEGLKRVPRTYTRMSSAQKEILARRNSWVVHRSDNATGFAVLPTEVQESLALFIIALDRGSSKASHQLSNTNVHNDEFEQGSGCNILRITDWDTSGMNDARQSTNRKTIGPEGDDKLHDSKLLSQASSSTEVLVGLNSPSNEQTRLLTPQSFLADLSSSGHGGHDGPQDLDLVNASDGSCICSWPATPQSELQSSPTSPGASEHRTNPPWTGTVEVPSNKSHPGQHVRTIRGRRYSSTYSIRSSHARIGRSRGSPSPSSAQGAGDIRMMLPETYCQNTAKFPSSSIQTEDELDLAVPHAMGEGINESDTRMVEVQENRLETDLDFHSNIAKCNSHVQVEHTPHLNNRGLRFPADWRSFQNPTKGNDKSKTFSCGPVSSDPIIPGTFDDGIPENSALAMESKADLFTTTAISGKSSAADPRDSSRERSLDADAPYAQETTGQAILLTGAEPSSPISRLCQMPMSSSNCSPQDSRSLTNIDDFMSDSSKNLISVERTVVGSSSSSDMEENATVTTRAPFAPARRRNLAVGSRTSVATTVKLDQDMDNAMNSREMARLERLAFTTRLLKKDMNQLLANPEAHALREKELIEDHLAKSATAESIWVDRQTNAVLIDPYVGAKEPQAESNTPLNRYQIEVEVEGSGPPVDVQPERLNQINITKDSSINTLHPDFFERFRLAYPNYVGHRRDFTWALVYIQWLRNRKQLVHRTLCDDFIRINSKEYIEYVRATQSLKERIMTGWEYYNSRDQEPEFVKRIITPDNLSEAVSSLNSTEVEESRRRFRWTYSSAGSEAHELSTDKQAQGTFEDQNGAETNHDKRLSVAGMPPRQGRTNCLERNPRAPYFQTPSQVLCGETRHNSGTVEHFGRVDSMLKLKVSLNKSPLPSENDSSTEDRVISATERRTNLSIPDPAGSTFGRGGTDLGSEYSGAPTEAASPEAASPELGRSENRQSLNSEKYLPSVFPAQTEKRLSLPSSELSSNFNRTRLNTNIVYAADVGDRQRMQILSMATSRRSVSFKDFVSQRRKAHALPSSMSKAEASRVKRVCTKLVGTEPTEPRTQAWELH